MSNLTPTRLYVEAQNGLASMTHALNQRVQSLRSEDEAGFEIPASMIIMVGLIALAIALVAALKAFGVQAVGQLKLP
ncbi:MAG: hypothetical protein L0G49_02135 [Luteococcus sp.]|uniref:hypothetical protein n=1 Tax=Luteococcus sp. TaxID=1969402 RepID=UPI0026490218|nr:hypothetical protein [Luteococcus sp.]MDN5562568.1 hypothetical protein [Luteococcus sp.]